MLRTEDNELSINELLISEMNKYLQLSTKLDIDDWADIMVQASCQTYTFAIKFKDAVLQPAIWK